MVIPFRIFQTYDLSIHRHILSQIFVVVANASEKLALLSPETHISQQWIIMLSPCIKNRDGTMCWCNLLRRLCKLNHFYTSLEYRCQSHILCLIWLLFSTSSHDARLKRTLLQTKHLMLLLVILSIKWMNMCLNWTHIN